MSEFAWRRRLTRHFGEQWVPYAELELKGADGRWRAFSVQVDTGAVVSVLPRSAASLLGFEHGHGEAIELAGVSAPSRRYFIHQIPARIGDSSEFPLRIAVADIETVPSLLGRLDVLDRFLIMLSPTFEGTRIETPSKVDT